MQWQYRDGDETFKPYPCELNYKLEKGQMEKKPFTEWTENDNTFRVMYDSMEEYMNGDPTNSVEVRRTGLQQKPCVL